MNRTKNLVLALGLVFVGAACGGGDSNNVDDNNAVSVDTVRSTKQRVMSPNVSATQAEALVDGNTAFALDLYQEVSGGDENVFYSPHSISIALAMTYAGARGQTETDMANVMHFDLVQDELHPAFNDLDLKLSSRGENAAGSDDEPFRLKIANSLWGSESTPFQEDFLDTLALNYGAGMTVLDFIGDPEGSRVTINDWVEDKTEDRIKDLIPQGMITSDTRLVLTNAVYFNASWLNRFEKEMTYDDDFNLVGGGTSTVPFMHQMATFGYAAGADYEALEMLYDGQEMSMLVLLPNEGVDMTAFEANLTPALLDEAVGSLADTSVQLALPKFEFTVPLPLTQTLIDMGMESAFFGADLSGIDGTMSLAITDVIHKAFVAVNEKGTEAAAATAVIVGETSAPQADVNFKADRPFIFLIRDNATGAIVFMGRVMDPAK